MKIFTKVCLMWDGSKYATVSEEWFNYEGDVAQCCFDGASSTETDLAKQQTGLFDTMQSELSTVFGASSNTYNMLNAAYSPIVAAGDNQMGYSLATNNLLRSQIVTTGAQQFAADAKGVREETAAMGGGNSMMPSGFGVGASMSVANQAANSVASNLAKESADDAQLGQNNFWTAAKGMAGDPNVFDAATSAGKAAESGGQAAFGEEHAINQENVAADNAIVGTIGAGLSMAADLLPKA